MTALTGAQALAERLTEADREAYRVETAADYHEPGKLTMSGIGGCTRAAAYALAGIPPSDPELTKGENRPANVGRWIHAGYLPRLAAALGEAGYDEQSLTLHAAGVEIEGHTDLALLGEAMVDLKTVGRWMWTQVVGQGIHPKHEMQLWAYALSLVQIGMPVKYVAVIYKNRDTGETYIPVQPFGTAQQLAVIHRVTDLVVYSQNLDDAPRDERGPGRSIICDTCAWLRECWGPGAEPGSPGAQRILIRDQADREEAIATWLDANARRKAAEREEEDAKDKLTGSTAGEYPTGTLFYSKDATVDDGAAAVKMLKCMGYDVPKTVRRGGLRIKALKR